MSIDITATHLYVRLDELFALCLPTKAFGHLVKLVKLGPQADSARVLEMRDISVTD